jgi:hypothetical protein
MDQNVARRSYSHSLSVQEVVMRLARHTEVNGVVMMGSGAVAMLNPTSDIDLLVVLSGSPLELKMVSTTIEGRLSEVYFVSASELDRFLEVPLKVHDYSEEAVRLRWIQTGQVLYDRSGRLERLRSVLTHGDWTSPPSDAEVYEAWFSTNYDLAQTRRLLGAADAASLMKVDLHMLLLLHELWERYYLVRRSPGLSEKARIRWMAANDPQAYALIQECLAECDRQRKFAILEKLAFRVLEAVGGLWPAEMTAVQLSPGANPELAEWQMDAWESWLA